MNTVGELLCDADAEEGIIATVLARPDGLAQLSGLIEPRHFFRSHHATIYGAAMAVCQRGEEVNQITVAHQLSTTDQLEGVGGQTFMADVVRRCPSVAGDTPRWYAGIVRELAMSRQTLSAATAISQLIRDNPNDAIRAIDRGVELLTGIAAEVSTEDVVSADAVLREGLWARVNNHIEDPSTTMGVRTGIANLDEAIGGIVRQRVYLYAAETSMGKSLLAQDVVRRLAKAGHRILVFCTEMSRQEVAWRIIFQEAGIDPQAHRDTGYSPGEKQRVLAAMDAMEKWPLTFCDRGDLSAAYLKGVVQRHKARHGDLFMIVVDHIDMVTSAAQNRTRELEGITGGLKTIGRDMDVAVWEVSHLSRLNDFNSRNKSSRLRNSESKAQDADIGFMLFPVKQAPTGEWVPMDTDEARQQMSTGLHMAADVFKNRHGRVGTHRLFLSWFSGGRFEDG